MKLIAFSVRNYRSILKAYKLSLGNYTVLVGPNNEGKSNILKAIALSLELLSRGHIGRIGRRMGVRYSKTAFRFDYDWKRDFPVSLQEKKPDGRSEFSLEFEFTELDFDCFRKAIGTNLNTNLKIFLGFGQDDTKLEVLMKGKGKKTLNNRKTEIVEFIKNQLTAEYISAIRPSDMALEIVNGLIENELSTLENDVEYKKLIDALQALQQPVLNKISEKLKTTVAAFIPAVKDIQIRNDHMSRAFRTSFNIIVDDGAKTELGLKGDGIISLTTISLMKHVSERGLGEKRLMLSIEEPESHLHPEAIHGIRRVLKDISVEQQVVITTHSPILVETEHVNQNIIVQNGHAIPAKKIEDIRQALGVHLSDNLVGAYIVLLVEGEEDKDLFSCWLKALSPKIAIAIDKKYLVIDHLAGASNLRYKVTFYKQNVCNIHAFMDNDQEGRNAIAGVLEKNLFNDTDYNLAICQGMKDSELEDLIYLSTYVDAVKKAFGVDLDQSRFHSARLKWSDRSKEIFKLSGKIWDDSTKMKLKRYVTDTAIKLGVASLNIHHRAPIDTLVSSLEAKLLIGNIG